MAEEIKDEEIEELVGTSFKTLEYRLKALINFTALKL